MSKDNRQELLNVLLVDFNVLLDVSFEQYFGDFPPEMRQSLALVLHDPSLAGLQVGELKLGLLGEERLIVGYLNLVNHFVD